MSNETDEGAREALVEQLAEAMLSGIRRYMGLPDADVVWNFSLVKAASIQAEEIAPLVAAQVEAAVSEVRAERDEARRQRDFWEQARDNFEAHLADERRAYRALREGLEALAKSGTSGYVPTHALWDLLAPSPAEGTGEAVPCDHDWRRHDATCHYSTESGWVTIPAPVSSGEAGRGGRCELDMCGGPPCWCGQDRPAPMVTPSAPSTEDGQP